MKGKKNFIREESDIKDINRSLSYLRKNEKFTDLRFVCQSGSGKAKKSVTISAHQAIFAAKSRLMAKLFEISHEKQLSDAVIISLDDTESPVVEKMLEYIYLGQTTIRATQRTPLKNLLGQLGLKIELEEEKSSTDAESDVAEELSPSIQKKKKVGPKSQMMSKKAKKPVVAADSDDSAGDDDDDGDAGEDVLVKSLKSKVAKDPGTIELEQLEKSSDNDVLKYYKKVARNPFHKASTSSPAAAAKSTPQKRRLTDSDKKVVSKASKKPRQEDDSSAEDSDQQAAVAARKKEMPVTKPALKTKARLSSLSDNEVVDKEKSRKSSESDSDPKPKKPTTTSNRGRPGPKGRRALAGPASATTKKKKVPEKTEAIDSMFCTENIICCGLCSAILVGKTAFDRHVATHEKGKSSPERKEQSEAKDSSDQASEPASNNSKKKSIAKIKEERRRSKRSSTSEDNDESEDESKKKAKVSRPVPTSTKRPGPKSKSAKSDDDNSKKPSVSKATPQSAGPASKKKKKGGPLSSKTASEQKEKTIIGSGNRKLSMSTTSDSENDGEKTNKSLMSSAKKSSNSVKISLGSSKKGSQSLGPSTPESVGAYNCRFCKSGYDKPPNLKNHVLNHFKEELMKSLPTCLPFLCPECKQGSRDKITLLRHYAFTHKKVFELAKEEDFMARPPNHPIRELPKGSSSTSSVSSKPTTSTTSSKKSKISTVSIVASSSDSSASEKDVPKKKAVKEDTPAAKMAVEEDAPAAKKTATMEEKKKKNNSSDEDEDSEEAIAKKQLALFTDSDSDGETAAKKKTTEVLKSFDELFADSEDKQPTDGASTKEASEEKKEEEVGEKDEATEVNGKSVDSN